MLGEAATASRHQRIRFGALIVTGVGIEACLLALVALGDLKLHIPFFLALFFIAFGLYAAALAVILRWRRPGPGTLALILLLSLLFRMTLVLAPPSLSDDIYRYVWEGTLVLDGVNPFSRAPEDPSLTSYRDEYYELINHREISTIYPPAAQVLFAASQVLYPGPASVKVLVALGDFLLVLLLRRILVARGANPGWVLLYAWSPLSLVEFSGNGHIDVFAILLLVLSLHLLDQGRVRWSVLTLSLSFLTKLFAICLLPLYWLRQRRVKPLLPFAVLSLVAFLPFVDAGGSLFRGGLEYATRWRHNGSGFDLLVLITTSPSLSKALIGLFFSAGAVLAARKWRQEPFHAALFLAGLFVILSPTVHPWYVVWVLPFVCLHPRASWLYLSGAVALSYLVLQGYAATGEWVESTWVRLVEYVPFYLLLLLETAGIVRIQPRWNRDMRDV